MKLIHLVWVASSDTDNNGHLNLWLESPKALNKKEAYPYQVDQKMLDEFAQMFFKDHVFKQTKLTMHFPCNKENALIPSPLIANIADIENREVESLVPLMIHTLEIQDALSFVKDLNFASYYFDDNVQLSDDARFWIAVVRELSTLIKHDQYIPYITALKQRTKLNFTMKWQPLSDEYNRHIKHMGQLMPYAACALPYADGLSVIENFSECVLTEFVRQTSFPQKHYNQVEGTIIDQALSLKDKAHITEDQWQLWKQWCNSLAYDQLGAPFKVVMRLDAPQEEDEDWSLAFLLQSKNDLSFMVDFKTYHLNKSRQKSMYQKMFGTSVERSLLLQLGYASRLFKPVERLFDAGLDTPEITLSKDEAFQFLKEDAWTLHACGYSVIVPSWWTKKGRLKAKVKIKASKRKRDDLKFDNPKGYLGYDSLVGFDYSYAIGEHQVSDKEWQMLLEAKSDLVFFRGQWIEIDPKEMQRMQKLIESSEIDKKEGSIKDLLEMAAKEDEFDIDVDAALEKMMDQLVNKDAITMLESPTDLQATLRPYQVRGLSWLAYLESIGMNPCLADDMGLGKTMQIISLLLARKAETPALLVAPTSVIGNWDREISKFAPELKTYIYHGANRKADMFHKAIENTHIVITSFGLLRRDKNVFQSQHWSRIIVDEAQNIKSPTAAQTKALCSLEGQSRIALTGTPVENRLMDLWSIFNFLNPGYLGNKTAFRKEFELPVQKDNDEYRTQMLKKMVEPFILRRVKTDKNIIKDLPDKIEQKVYCQLTKEQASIYQAIVDETEERLRTATGIEKNAIFVSSLLKLKQACNHPAQVLQDGSAFTPERSVKLQRLLDMTKEIMLNGESVLIFSQFTEVCQELEKIMRQQHGYMTYYLHGGTSRPKREKMITEFQNPESPPAVFILSLKAGGVGITLTKANHVIHFDRWWNPAVENQATDRAYRIGQEKTVFAHKYITAGTIEESIDQMLEDKQRVSDMIVGSDESWLGTLDTRSFMDLIKLKNQMVTEDEYA
ncbi:DEAD/DEAH box helicase [Cysteiniphilum sp. SYW-8]|nr:DEAD/DEAH box helicase [Cysteiniphilum sp. SYW-8]